MSYTLARSGVGVELRWVSCTMDVGVPPIGPPTATSPRCSVRGVPGEADASSIESVISNARTNDMGLLEPGLGRRPPSQEDTIVVDVGVVGVAIVLRFICGD